MVLIDTLLLKEEALDSLLSTLDTIRGKKCLVIDRALASTLSTVVSFSVLQEHGVDKMFWLQSPSLVSLINSSYDSPLASSTTRYITFLVPTLHTPASANLVAQAAQELLSKKDNQSDDATSNITYDLSLIQVPDKSPDFTSILEFAGVLGDISIYTWPIYFVPIAQDLLSLNLPNGGGYKEAYLHNMPSTVYHAASAIQDIQQRYGLIGRITGKGKTAQQLVDILLRKREERQTDLSEIVSSSSITNSSNDLTGKKPPKPKPTPSDFFNHQYANIFTGTNIDQLVVIDRQSDPLTPLLTQLTYEGLIEEFYGLTESGQVELPANIVTPQASGGGAPVSHSSNDIDSNLPSQTSVSIDRKKVTLGNDHDELFQIIRDANFSTVGHTLNKVARQLQSDYELRHEAKTVNQIKAFVGKLGGLQSLHQVLRLHTALAEDLMGSLKEEEFNKWLEIQQNLVADTLDLTQIHAMIEDLIDRSSSMTMILRLLCIDSICNGGIKEKELTHFKSEFLQTFGYHHLATFENLNKLGILYPRQPSKPNWFPTVRKQLNLISDQTAVPSESDTTVNGIEFQDISYTYSGYSPLSVRIVQTAIDKTTVLAGTPTANKLKRMSRASAGGLVGGLGTGGWRALGWKGAEEILKYIPGSRVDEVQHDELFVREGKLRKILAKNSQTHHRHLKNSSKSRNNNKKEDNDNEEEEEDENNSHLATIVVFYIGGITYAEISALRYLSAKSKLYNIIIATTGLISGDKIIQSAIEVDI